MSYGRLSLEDRIEISNGLSQGETYHVIASRLGRHVSTISREVSRNWSTTGDGYRASQAERKARSLASNTHRKKCKIQVGNRLFGLMVFKLKKRWSPRQISTWLKSEYSRETAMNVSSETIYEFIYVQAKGELKKNSMKG